MRRIRMDERTIRADVAVVGGGVAAAP